MLPNLVVIGGRKCGTTSLYYYLRQHPQIFMSSVKELWFFNGRNWDRGVDWYESHFEGATAPVRGEATPAYTNYPLMRGTPGRMHSLIPEAKLVYLVRDPIERVLSAYLDDYSLRRDGYWPEDPLRARPAHPQVAVSSYAFQLERYLDHYPMDQILVLSQEELLGTRRETMREVFSFLEVDDSFDSPKFDELRNVSTGKRRVRWRSPLLPRNLHPKQGEHRFRWETRARVKGVVFRPFTKRVERPVLEPEQRRGWEELLKPDADRLRQLTGKAFADWSV